MTPGLTYIHYIHAFLGAGAAADRRNRKMRKILIVIDMQNDFIDGALGTSEAVGIVEAVKEKIRSYPAADVIATMDTHFDNYMQTQEGKYLPVPHCIRETAGWEIRPEIAALLKEAKIYEKPKNVGPNVLSLADCFSQFSCSAPSVKVRISVISP